MNDQLKDKELEVKEEVEMIEKVNSSDLQVRRDTALWLNDMQVAPCHIK